jgi:hypothetical protein
MAVSKLGKDFPLIIISILHTIETKGGPSLFAAAYGAPFVN